MAPLREQAQSLEVLKEQIEIPARGVSPEIQKVLHHRLLPNRQGEYLFGDQKWKNTI